MTLYLIGLGLENEQDITLKALNIIKSCHKIYLENYTSLLQCTKEDLEKLYQKPITLADRTTAEQFDEIIIQEAKTNDIAFLIIGDPVSATTHIELFKLAKQHNIEVKIIHNASILTAVGITGLQLYKFGKTTSIPFPELVPNLETPYIILKENQSIGAHTLFLLDLKPNLNKFLTIPKAIEILQNIEKNKQLNLITKQTKAIACARLGTNNYIIKYNTLEKLKTLNYGQPPYCLIIPGKLHFLEQEMLELWE